MKQVFSLFHGIKMAKHAQRIQSGLLAVLFLLGSAFYAQPVAYADTVSDLTAQKEELEQSLSQHKDELEDLEDQVETEAQKQQYLKSEIDVLSLQIDVIVATIAQVQEEISQTQFGIQEKIAEIDTKQKEYDAEFALFGERLSAMQELNDGGAIAILSTVQNLYQLLTFDQTLQDISDKNAQMLASLETQRIALETAKTELEESQVKLEAQYADLAAQNEALESTKASIYANYIALGNSIAQAEAAMEGLEETIEMETIKYAEVDKQLQDLINSAEDDHDDLVFGGAFIVPVPAGAYYISRGFNAATPHYGIDYAAPAWTPIYASAAGYVTASQYSSSYGNYVLIYHGACADSTFSTLYAHMVQSPSVSVGTYVTQGQLLGYVGNTGASRGNHLHFELWANASIGNSVAHKAQRVNPAPYVG